MKSFKQNILDNPDFTKIIGGTKYAISQVGRKKRPVINAAGKLAYITGGFTYVKIGDIENESKNK